MIMTKLLVIKKSLHKFKWEFDTHIFHNVYWLWEASQPSDNYVSTFHLHVHFFVQMMISYL